MKIQKAGTWAVAVASLAALGGLFGCASSGRGAQGEQQEIPVVEAAPEDVRGNILSYTGRNVESEGKVLKLLGPNAFVIEGADRQNLVVVVRDPNLSSDQRLRIPPPTMPVVKAGDTIAFRGKAGSLTLNSITQVYGVDREPLARLFTTEKIPAVEVSPKNIEVG